MSAKPPRGKRPSNTATSSPDGGLTRGREAERAFARSILEPTASQKFMDQLLGLDTSDNKNETDKCEARSFLPYLYYFTFQERLSSTAIVKTDFDDMVSAVEALLKDMGAPDFKTMNALFFIHTRSDDHDIDVKEALDIADLNPDAFDFLCSVGAVWIRGGADRDPPPDLRTFLADVLTGKRKRPAARGRPADTRVKHVALQFAVGLTAQAFGLSHTRNDATDENVKPSASDVVADAMKRLGAKPEKYERIADVWKVGRDLAPCVWNSSVGWRASIDPITGRIRLTKPRVRRWDV